MAAGTLDVWMDPPFLRGRFFHLRQSGLTSPLESAVSDGEHVAVCARPMFLTTPGMTGAHVRFDLPRGWRAVPPWPNAKFAKRTYHAATNLDLTDNFLVFSVRPPDIIAAKGFRMQLTAMGHWSPLRPLIRRTLQAIVSREVALMGYDQQTPIMWFWCRCRTLAAKLTGKVSSTPSRILTRPISRCGQIPWRMRFSITGTMRGCRARTTPAPSGSRKGYTEYVANLTMVESGIVTPEAFLAKLSDHVANNRRLTTTLEAIGTHKGPRCTARGRLSRSAST